MSQTATATVGYGIDFGDSEGWNFDLPTDEYGDPTDLPEPYSEDFDVYDLIKESGVMGIEGDAYGYEYTGKVVYISGTDQKVYWDCEPLERSLSCGSGWDDRIEQFLMYLDTKGLILKDEFRTPGWLLMVSYG